jgi:hypothetical protein
MGMIHKAIHMLFTTIFRRLASMLVIAALAAVMIPAVSQAGDPTLDSTYTIQSVTLNQKKGTAVIAVTVNLPGTVAIGKNDEHNASTAFPKGPGVVTVVLKPRGALRKTLKKKGHALVKYNISFTPTNGNTNTQSHKLVLKYKKH